jgi:SAM-dependent methyltransferase
MPARRLARLLPAGLKRPLSALRRVIGSLPPVVSRQKERLLRSPSLQPAERDLLLHVETTISPRDGMYRGDAQHYFRVGLSAIRCIDEALGAAIIENESVRHILDLPSGYGRVLRFLVARFPHAQVTAGEIEPQAVDFCVRTFGARPLYSSRDFATLSLERPADLIWCGSLVTHLDAQRIVDLISFLQRQLSPGGLLVVTTHGDFVARRMLDEPGFYGLDRRAVSVLTATYRDRGYGYLDYPSQSGYGVSLTSPRWIRVRAREVGGLHEVYFNARGWDGHQDVYGFVRKRPSPGRPERVA